MFQTSPWFLFSHTLFWHLWLNVFYGPFKKLNSVLLMFVLEHLAVILHEKDLNDVKMFKWTNKQGRPGLVIIQVGCQPCSTTERTVVFGHTFDLTFSNLQWSVCGKCTDYSFRLFFSSCCFLLKDPTILVILKTTKNTLTKKLKAIVWFESVWVTWCSKGQLGIVVSLVLSMGKVFALVKEGHVKGAIFFVCFFAGRMVRVEPYTNC